VQPGWDSIRTRGRPGLPPMGACPAAALAAQVAAPRPRAWRGPRARSCARALVGCRLQQQARLHPCAHARRGEQHSEPARGSRSAALRVGSSMAIDCPMRCALRSSSAPAASIRIPGVARVGHLARQDAELGRSVVAPPGAQSPRAASSGTETTTTPLSSAASSTATAAGPARRSVADAAGAYCRHPGEVVLAARPTVPAAHEVARGAGASPLLDRCRGRRCRHHGLTACCCWDMPTEGPRPAPWGGRESARRSADHGRRWPQPLVPLRLACRASGSHEAAAPVHARRRGASGPLCAEAPEKPAPRRRRRRIVYRRHVAGARMLCGDGSCRRARSCAAWPAPARPVPPSSASTCA
jgi:hypothetical protein